MHRHVKTSLQLREILPYRLPHLCYCLHLLLFPSPDPHLNVVCDMYNFFFKTDFSLAQWNILYLSVSHTFETITKACCKYVLKFTRVWLLLFPFCTSKFAFYDELLEIYLLVFAEQK